MTSDDFDFTLRMTDSEKWGYLRADFERHIESDPDGCFIARSGDKYIGMLTTTSYGSYAFLGGLIVPEEFRGRGIATKLMLHGIEYLKTEGVISIELDGVFPAVPLYRRLGFEDKYLSLRFYRNLKTGADDSIPPTPYSINDILKYDKEKTGLDRGRLLRVMSEQLPDSVFVEKQPGAFGYSIVKPCAGDLSMIGPMVCDNIRIAEILLKSAIRKFGRRVLLLGVPELNNTFVKLLLHNGFKYSPPVLRMYLGEPIEYEKSIYGILSPGQG